jgi:hypothetical protein
MTAWPLQSPDLTLLDFFLCRHLKEHIYAVPPRPIENLVVRLQAAVILVDNIPRHVQENTVRHTAVCLEMDTGHSELLLKIGGTHSLIVC